MAKFRDITDNICAGMSSKKMIADAIGDDKRSRLYGSLTAHVLAAIAGARILRVHHVQPMRDAVDVMRWAGYIGED